MPRTTKRVPSKTATPSEKLEWILLRSGNLLDLSELQILDVATRNGVTIADAGKQLIDEYVEIGEQPVRIFDAIQRGLEILRTLNTDEKIEEAYISQQRAVDLGRRDAELERLTADVSLWASKERWSLDEAATLAVGVDPKKFEAAKLKSKVSGELTRLIEFIREEIDRSSLKVGGVGKKYILATEFETWAKKALIGITLNLPTSAKQRNQEVSKNRMNSIDRIILGIALEKYRFDYNYGRGDQKSFSKTFSEMKQDIIATGLVIDADTIQGILLGARDRVPAENIKKKYKSSDPTKTLKRYDPDPDDKP